jgi:hypothetical protein
MRAINKEISDRIGGIHSTMGRLDIFAMVPFAFFSVEDETPATKFIESIQRTDPRRPT